MNEPAPSLPRVYLFGTCLIDVYYPAAGLDALALLELAGYEVIFPQAQTCCGQPPYNSGYQKMAKPIAIATVELFSDTDLPLIVPSASCAGMIRNHYPTLLKEYPRLHEKAVALASRTHEILDFLLDKLPYEQASHRISKPVVHRSCAAHREVGVADQWHQILQRLPGCTPGLPEGDNECCGFGGTFSIKSPEISAAMTEDKCQALLAENPDRIVTGDCGCLMNIEGHLKHRQSSIPCEHILSTLARQFGVHHDA